MKEEALKLADELQAYMTSLGWKTHQAPEMIRRLVDELDKQWYMVNKDGYVKPLSDEEIENMAFNFVYDDDELDIFAFARAIEKRHGIK